MLTLVYILLVCYGPILDPIFPKLSFGAGIPDIGLERMATYLLVLLYLVYVAITSEIDNVFNLWLGMIAFFLAIHIASVSWSSFSYNARTLRYIFDSCITPFLIAIIAFRIFKEKSSVHFFIINITISSFVLSIYSIYQMLWSQVVVRGYVRSTASFDNPNGLAIFLVLTVPCVFYGNKKRLFPKLLQIPVWIIIFGGIFCTASRKGIITGVLAILIFLLGKGKLKKAIIVLLPFIFTVIILGSFDVFEERLSSDLMDKSLSNKQSFVLAGIRMFIDHPIIGLGYDGYYMNFGRYIKGSSKDDKEHYDAHNIFITALANFGIVGFIPFLSIFIIPIYFAVNHLRYTEGEYDNFSRDMALIALSSVLTFMLNGYFAGGLFYKQSIIVLLYSNVVLFLANTNENRAYA